MAFIWNVRKVVLGCDFKIIHSRVFMSLMSRRRAFLIILVCSSLFILLARISIINQPQHITLIDDPHSECYQKIQESTEYLVSEAVNISCDALETPGCQQRFAKYVFNVCIHSFFKTEYIWYSVFKTFSKPKFGIMPIFTIRDNTVMVFHFTCDQVH